MEEIASMTSIARSTTFVLSQTAGFVKIINAGSALPTILRETYLISQVECVRPCANWLLVRTVSAAI